MKGICFFEPLFNAVINGTKTQTRRIVKPQPEFISNDNNMPRNFHLEFIKPKYQVGEKVYLKEPYCNKVPGYFGVAYKYIPSNVNQLPEENTNFSITWQNKLFMPTKYARYFIEITAVRCERLQEISDEDCFKEGILQEDIQKPPHFDFFTPKEAYAALIDQINGKGTWESNPWVWAYDFNLVK
jgi:hypothetical protein